MKPYRPQKRKIVEITRKEDECMVVSVKKSANGTGFGSQNSTESIRVPQLEPQIQLQVSSAKIKLQLFPINEQTRLGLEKDGYNPFLELILSRRKRISSVISHMNTKWGNSSVAKGVLMLFPYNTKLDQVASWRRWTSNDSGISAWEVYVDVGSPSFFRLRYAWYSSIQQEMFDNMPPKSRLLEAHIDSEGKRRSCGRGLQIPNHGEKKIDESSETIKKQIDINEASHSDMNEPKALHVPTGLMDDEVTNNDFLVHSTVPWDDSLTNLSIGGLLSEISMQGKINGPDPNSVNKSGMQPIELISDISIGDLLSESSLLSKMKSPSMEPQNESSLHPIVLASSDISIGGLLSEASQLSKKNRLDTGTTQAGRAKIQSPLNDNFSTLSIGGLLSEASLQAKACGNQYLEESKPHLQPDAPLSDSFDPLFLDQPNAHLRVPKPSGNDPNLSILDAEETCHAFPIRKLQSSRPTSNTRASSRCSNDMGPNQFQFPKVAKMNDETVSSKDSSCQELKTSPYASFSSGR
ncbi:hypothetical protein CDL12_20178 [Handroanthus impetiginosus]|uniref:TSL-kinase interacting protein 1 n=1 Tax=Handroanthus impetiginosus TaxID=429701 RepID=A0A2G9GPT1_9LAMI|nr:hypothetical protein CDL12_20178 [Handroanthus impetiginosus]